MTSEKYQRNASTADRIREAAPRVAETTTELFYARHPDWVERFGVRGRRLSVEDAVYHQQFLAAAVESGTVEPFLDYVRWSRRVLEARGISRSSFFARRSTTSVRRSRTNCPTRTRAVLPVTW
jgi:hypothetical protein